MSCNWKITCKKVTRWRNFECFCTTAAWNQNGLCSLKESNQSLIPLCMITHWLSQLSHIGLEREPGISRVSPHVPLPWPRCGSLNRTADQPLASWLGRLTQLRLSLSGSLLLSLTVNRRRTTAHAGPCQVWGLASSAPPPALSTPPIHNPHLLVRNRACLKWKSMFRFSGAWHLPALSQAIKIDEVFITSSPVPAFSKDHDRLLCWLCAWVRVRGWGEAKIRSFPENYILKHSQES